MEFINIEADNIKAELFSNFKRYQKVTKCWRKIEGQWVIKDINFTEEWGIEEYKILSSCLKNTVETGGMVMGAFSDGILKGFVSVEAGIFGENKESWCSKLELNGFKVNKQDTSLGERYEFREIYLKSLIKILDK